MRRLVKRPGPRHRAPSSLRTFVGLLAIGTGLTTVALMLSDRAPGILRSLFGDTARRLWQRVDPERRALVDGTVITEADVVVHVALWATVTSLLGLVIWTWRGAIFAAAFAAVASTVVEFGQRRWASTRAFETSDLMANLVGVALGLIGAVGVMSAWTLAAEARRRRG